METFTCLMYGHTRETSVDVVRGKMLPKMVGEDESLPSSPRLTWLISHPARIIYFLMLVVSTTDLPSINGPTSHTSGNTNPAMMDNNG